MNLSARPKIVIKVIVVVILIACPIDLLIDWPLINLAPLVSIALPEAVFKTECFFRPICFLFSTVSCNDRLDTVVENAGRLARLELRLVQKTVLNVVALLQKVIVLL